MMAVRKELKWTLGAAGALSLLVLQFPNDSQPVKFVDRDLRADGGNGGWGATPRGRSESTSDAVWLPMSTDRELLAVAGQDPFGQAAPAAPPAAKQAVMPMPAPPKAQMAAPPVAQAPAMVHRFIGSMRTPDGLTLVYVSDGVGAVPVRQGTTLNSGYVVEAVSDHEVRLVYPALAHQVSIVIPPAPTP